jgi:hypothetical protein
MKNKWLDNYGEEENYNDSQTTAPQGFDGDGYSNVGRNYSPAWGGQFQEGGEIPQTQNGTKKPIYVSSTNDPRYKAYQDSLNLYNYGNRNKKYVGDYLNRKLGENPSQLLHKLDDNTRNSFKDIAYHEQVENKFNKIKPIHKTNIYASAQGIKNNLIFTLPSWKKPQQQVIVKPTTTKPITISSKTTPIVEREQLTSLQPMSVGLQDVNQQIGNPNINIPIQARVPQYYNIQDTNKQNFGGGDTSYRTEDLSSLRELPKEQWERKITPQYQMGGSVYPVNYVPQAQDGEIVGDAGQEIIDYLQRYSRYTKGMPGIGSAIGITQSLANEEDMKASDKLGLFPHPYMQAASLTALYAEKEKQNLEDYAKRQLEHNSFSKLLKEKTNKQLVNDKKVDNTYIPKPKIEKIKTNIKQTPYIEHKDINTKVIDNTSVSRSRKGFQTGGSIPGAVGFTYARTKGIPSEGPYAKKTLPSAQNGVDMYGTPITAIENHRYDIDRTYYDPRTNKMNLGADYAISDNKNKIIAHENYHAKQHNEGKDNFDIGHNTDNKQWAEMQKRPEMMSTPEVWNNFYNRKGIESDMMINRIAENIPESQFFRNAAGDIIYNKIVDSAQYKVPYSFEGEAEYYENTGEEFQNGGEMRYYQNGLDWKPKSISQQGSVIKDDRGQWDHPGEITEINSPYITMQGVPYPVLGISDTGDTQMMYPEEEYEFDGKKVTEYPMAQNGLRQEQKSLQNLDNLVNFTNYNIKQSGGWLDTL